MIMEVKCKNKETTREVLAWNPPINWVRETIERAGTTIGSVHFRKRSDGKLRKLSYRLHCSNPSFASSPKGLKEVGGKSLKHEVSHKVNKVRVSRKVIDRENNQMTVFDTNKVIRGEDGAILGRGAYRCIPLENVERISNKGIIYTIKRISYE
jgi:hypothetical protein